MFITAYTGSQVHVHGTCKPWLQDCKVQRTQRVPVRCLSAIGRSQTGSPQRTPRTSSRTGVGGRGLSSVSALVSSRKNVPLASSLSLFPSNRNLCLFGEQLAYRTCRQWLIFRQLGETPTPSPEPLFSPPQKRGRGKEQHNGHFLCQET